MCICVYECVCISDKVAPFEEGKKACQIRRERERESEERERETKRKRGRAEKKDENIYKFWTVESSKHSVQTWIESTQSRSKKPLHFTPFGNP